MTKIKISEAKALAKKYGYEGIAIFAFKEDGAFDAVTYGANKSKCADMGQWANKVGNETQRGEWLWYPKWVYDNMKPPETPGIPLSGESND